jgi:hypothetical protein
MLKSAEWIHLAQNRGQLDALENTLIILRLT